jgi:hypothetical protein
MRQTAARGETTRQAGTQARMHARTAARGETTRHADRQAGTGRTDASGKTTSQAGI